MSATQVTIDLIKNKKGNLLMMSSTSDDTVRDDPDNVSTVRIATVPDGCSVTYKQSREVNPRNNGPLVILLGGPKKEELILSFNSHTGGYEIQKNSFDPAYLSELTINIHRDNLNKFSVPMYLRQ